MTFLVECPVCDGTGRTRAVGTPGCPVIACAWCLHTGRVTETQRDWLIDEAAHLYLPGRDDTRLLADYHAEFPCLLADGFEQAVLRVDDMVITRLARETGVLT